MRVDSQWQDNDTDTILMDFYIVPNPAMMKHKDQCGDEY